nr:MAG: hypothetical protein [Guangxi alphaflexi-like virus]
MENVSATAFPSKDLVCPTCGKIFLHPPNFAAHLLKHPQRTGDALTPGAPLADTSLSAADAKRQFSAILGDLEHKLDVYDLFKTFGPSVDHFFSNASQAKYLQIQKPELIPRPGLSDHTLGTIFEDHYHSDIVFRSQYICYLYSKM